MLEVVEGRGREEEAEEEGGEDPPRGVGSRSLCGEGGRDPSVTASPDVINTYSNKGQRKQEQGQEKDNNSNKCGAVQVQTAKHNHQQDSQSVSQCMLSHHSDHCARLLGDDEQAALKDSRTWILLFSSIDSFFVLCVFMIGWISNAKHISV